jgi:hypothetical protein
MVEAYTLALHAHRYAAWCAARASGRGLTGSTNATIREALEASALPAVIDSPSSSWPTTSHALDAAHRKWCEQVLASLHQAGVSKATFGRAAKIVAIYLKTRVVCGGHLESPLGRLAHPPIDRVLLQALAKEPSFSKENRSLWRRTSWTELDRAGYAEVIRSLQAENLDQDGFWRVEKWWVGDVG